MAIPSSTPESEQIYETLKAWSDSIKANGYEPGFPRIRQALEGTGAVNASLLDILPESSSLGLGATSSARSLISQSRTGSQAYLRPFRRFSRSSSSSQRSSSPSAEPSRCDTALTGASESAMVRPGQS